MKTPIYLICVVLLIFLILFSLHSRAMDRRFRRLQDRVEVLNAVQMKHEDLLGGIENWMRKSLAQSCDTLPSCDKYDKMWLKGKTKCPTCGKWIKEPCPHCEKEKEYPCPIHENNPCPELEKMKKEMRK